MYNTIINYSILFYFNGKAIVLIIQIWLENRYSYAIYILDNRTFIFTTIIKFWIPLIYYAYYIAWYFKLPIIGMDSNVIVTEKRFDKLPINAFSVWFKLRL